MTRAYPLLWPQGRPRRHPSKRKTGVFSTRGDDGYKQELTVANALDRLQRELDLIKARYVVVSSNVEPRLDGRPRSGLRTPDDPGVALYFRLADVSHCLPCDTYTTVEANIAAIAAHIEATRKIERHGVATVNEMFSGFAALPPPPPKMRHWSEVFGIPKDAPAWMIEAAYEEFARKAHPDRGGSDAAMAEVNAARDAALKEVGNA